MFLFRFILLVAEHRRLDMPRNGIVYADWSCCIMMPR